jgi:hypothetical protein
VTNSNAIVIKVLPRRRVHYRFCDRRAAEHDARRQPFALGEVNDLESSWALTDTFIMYIHFVTKRFAVRPAREDIDVDV